MSKYAALFHMEESMKTSTKKYDKDIVHCFGVLQTIVYTSSILNTLLGDVVILPKISEFVSGTFLYNVVMYISKKPEQLKDCFLPEKMREEFLRIFNLISSLLPNLQPVNTKPMKKKKPRQKTDTSEYSDFIESDLAESESETGFFDVENRFSALKVSWHANHYVMLQREMSVAQSEARSVSSQPVDPEQNQLEALLFKVWCLDFIWKVIVEKKK